MAEDFENGQAGSTEGTETINQEPIGGDSTVGGESTPFVFVGEDGSLNDGWLDHIDEDLRSEKCLESVKDFKGMVKSYVHAQRAFGKDKIPKPNETSSESEWNDFFRIAGWPETSDSYGFEKPEGIPDEMYDSELATRAAEALHNLRLTPEQAKGIFEFQIKESMDSMRTLELQQQAALEQSMEDFRRKYGDLAAEKQELGNIAIDRGVNGDIELQQRVVEKYGSDGDFVQLMVNLGGMFAEANMIPELQNAGPSINDLQDEINELTVKQIKTDKRSPDYGSIETRLKTLYQQLDRVKKAGQSKMNR